MKAVPIFIRRSRLGVLISLFPRAAIVSWLWSSAKMKSIFGLFAPATKQELNKTKNELVLMRLVNVDLMVDKIFR